MSSPKFPYTHALVTGASSGIGAALCRHLDQVGIAHITLVARRRKRLEQLASSLGCSTTVIQADLNDELDRQAVLDQASTVDLLVNNAGFGSFGSFANSEVKRQLDMVSLNCQVPLHLTSAILPQMISAGRGCVVNIASGSAFQPMPYMSTYGATKSFLLHWSEGIREELRGTGVNVIAICPGTIDTEFAKSSAIPLQDIPAAALVTGSLDSLTTAIISGIQNDRGVVVPGLGNFLGSLSTRFAPRLIVRKLIAATMVGAAKQLDG
jgi:short-subunit dehydrogenase